MALKYKTIAVFYIVFAFVNYCMASENDFWKSCDSRHHCDTSEISGLVRLNEKLISESFLRQLNDDIKATVPEYISHVRPSFQRVFINPRTNIKTFLFLAEYTSDIGFSVNVDQENNIVSRTIYSLLGGNKSGALLFYGQFEIGSKIML